MSSDPQAVFLLVIMILFFVSITRPLFGTATLFWGTSTPKSPLSYTLVCSAEGSVEEGLPVQVAEEEQED
jgi:hypothetical protein